MVTEKRLNAEVFCEFLKRLIAGATRSVYLIVDNHPVHRSKQVKQFVEETNVALKIFYLPPYSPDLTPDEQVWNYVKNHNIGRQSEKNKMYFIKRVKRVMFSLQKMPEKVRSFFKHPVIKFTEMFVNLCAD